MCHYKKGPRKTMSDNVKRGTPLSAWVHTFNCKLGYVGWY